MSEAPVPGPSLEATTTGSAAGTLKTGGPYNVRTGPGTSYSRTGTMTAGTSVTVVCTTSRTSSTTGETTQWARLRSEGLNRWLMAKFVTYDAGAPTPPGCDSSAGPKIAAGVRGDDYPYRNDPYANCANDPWNFCLRQCTSFTTWRLRDVNGIAFKLNYGGKGWGSAGSWASTARSLGYRVDKTPKVGDVAHWDKSSSRPSGHVAWVASVSSDGQSVTIEEYNVNTKYGYGKRTLSVSSINNFIHLY